MEIMQFSCMDMVWQEFTGKRNEDWPWFNDKTIIR